ncbi:fibrinogen-like protein 1 [Drosophila subpulchrella]|uniref:fibrinogen-like protein 1 n=1 Tax=Drosophila subpulchrella TaxID=1486046 RepID=UPI0018A16ECF|nr:fibrinogen-like protein 1 [Drosophila subpulchrella]
MKTRIFLVFVSSLTLLLVSRSGADLAHINSNEKKCNEYCFSALSHIFEHFAELKQAVDENAELNRKINTMTATIEGLKNQLFMSEHQISDLRNHIESLKKTISERADEGKTISELSTYIKSFTKTMSERVEQDEHFPETCPSGVPNGIYQVKPHGMEPFKVPCVSLASGWTVIQRRFDGSVDFNRTWEEYKNGFGDIKGEFFIGLEKIHLLTESRPHELYITLRKVNGSTGYAHYNDFKLGNENESYELKTLGKISGTVGDSLEYHKKCKFSTFDNDNNCARSHGGGWWFKDCAKSSLNGQFYKDGQREDQGSYGIFWGSWQSYNYQISLTFVEMMIRPKAL